MVDVPAQIKADIAIIRSEIAALRTHTSDLKTWVATHMIFAIPAAIVIGWSMGKIF